MNPCAVHELCSWPLSHNVPCTRLKHMGFAGCYSPLFHVISFLLVLSVGILYLHTVVRHMTWVSLIGQWKCSNQLTKEGCSKVTLRIGGLCYKVSSCSKFTKSSWDYGLAHTQSSWFSQVCSETFINNLPSVSRHNTPDRRLNSADKKIKSLHYPEVT